MQVCDLFVLDVRGLAPAVRRNYRRSEQQRSIGDGAPRPGAVAACASVASPEAQDAPVIVGLIGAPAVSGRGWIAGIYRQLAGFWAENLSTCGLAVRSALPSRIGKYLARAGMRTRAGPPKSSKSA
jgi:hypothetical protein